MTDSHSQSERDFERAFQLAYFIHANKDIAFFVAEDALDQLPTMLGSQAKNRTPAEKLRGFWKSGERTRPTRKTLRLNEQQMLQWLVYRQSLAWERQTETGGAFYLPSEEDLIVRYVLHLVATTVRRGSFYVTLAVCSLLHQFDRRETRMFYDILTQGDSARMKDSGYIGKQRLELMQECRRRFGNRIQAEKLPGDEKRFVIRPATPSLIKLVDECLERFLPWDTTCVVEPGFEVTDIPGLYFSGAGLDDEDRIDMNRIHTVLHPECFSRFLDGLSRFIRALARDHQDKACDYNSIHQRLAVPLFSDLPAGPSRPDRFQPLELTDEDLIRLRRTLEARVRRRKGFSPTSLFVYVDDVLSESFDPSKTNQVRFRVGAGIGLIEVRGRDAIGELTLAILLVAWDEIPLGGALQDRVVHPGGQGIEIRLTPIRDALGDVETAIMEVIYDEPRRRWTEALARLGPSRLQGPGYVWLAKASLLATLLLLVITSIWLWLGPRRRQMAPSEQAEAPPVEETKPVPEQKEQPSAPQEAPRLIARAAWSMDPAAALRAIPIEPTRAESHTLDLSHRESSLLLSIPRYDDLGHLYPRYRVTIRAAGKRLWRETLRAPAASDQAAAHILNLTLFREGLPRKGVYDVRVEGQTKPGWRRLGHVSLSVM
jgi:hypothetical protein